VLLPPQGTPADANNRQMTCWAVVLTVDLQALDLTDGDGDIETAIMGSADIVPL